MNLSWSLYSDTHPLQPLYMEADGRTLRFKANPLIKHLFDWHPDIAGLFASRRFSWDDCCQVCQLAGLEWSLLRAVKLDPFHGQPPRFFRLKSSRHEDKYVRLSPAIDLDALQHPPQPVVLRAHPEPNDLWGNPPKHFWANALVVHLIKELKKGQLPAFPQATSADVEQIIQLQGPSLYPRSPSLSNELIERAERWFEQKKERLALGEDCYQATLRERALNRVLPAATVALPKSRF